MHGAHQANVFSFECFSFVSQDLDWIPDSSPAKKFVEMCRQPSFAAAGVDELFDLDASWRGNSKTAQASHEAVRRIIHKHAKSASCMNQGLRNIVSRSGQPTNVLAADMTVRV